MKSFFLLSLFVFIFLNTSFSQADCSSAIMICGNTKPFNPSGVGTKLEELACGGIEHNSVWLAFQAKANGKLNFVIRAFTLAGLPTPADFDWTLFALSGPPGSANCDAKTQISCNFAGTSTVFGIGGATGMATPNYVFPSFNPGVDVANGNWYVLLVDQFNNTTPLLFSVQFTGNPESNYLNSSPGIFGNAPDFTINNTSACRGTFDFANSSSATSGIASYSWNFGDGDTSTLANPTHTYLTSGTYYVTLTVTDNNGCTSDIRKTLVYNNIPPAINSAGLLMTPACSDGNNGSITINTIGANTNGITGGTPPYTYELVSPSPSIRPSQNSNVFSGLQPGAYSIKATDACGKAVTANITVTQVLTNSTIGLSVQNIQSACTNSPTGTATLYANGTTPPYTLALINSSPVLAAPVTGLLRDPVTANYYATFTGLLPGVYTVEAKDGCGKVRRATFTVTASTAPTVGLVNSASCATSATGLINVTATAASGLTSSGSPGSFQYALIAPSPITRPFQNSSIFENLLPGAYTVAVKDVCGNIGSGTTTIGTAGSPTFGTAFTTLSCPNGSTGTIEIQVANVGGGTPFRFELIAPSPVTRSPQSNNLFDSLPPGVYTVRLTDACGTKVTSNVTVPAATAPTFTTVITPRCTDEASGTVTIAPGATSISPYTFELISPGAAIRPPQGSNIANSFSSIFTGLSQGLYTVRMTDGCGVPVTNAATVSAPSAFTFPTGSATIRSCAGSATGRITVTEPTTGLGAYKYELIAPSPVTAAPQYSRIFDNLPAGNYTVRVTDSCGSQATIEDPLNIAVATAPSLVLTNTSSCVTNTGTITAAAATANQGGGTYQYALIAPSPVTKPNQSSPIFTGLPAGTYTVQITDQCGATGTASTIIAVAGSFTPSASGSVVACNGTGYYAQIIVTNPHNFTSGGPIPPGSGGGPYTYAVYDATNTTLIAGPQSSNVFSTVTPVGGTPSHTIRVTDSCGNTSTVTVTINPPAALNNAVISATTRSCATGSTGVVRVTAQATGGLPPYQYTLIDAVTTAVVSGPQSGIVFNAVASNATGYLIRATDACGNTTTSTTPLLYSSATTPTATLATTASCSSSSTGRIIVTPGTGGTLAGGTFSYELYDAGNTTLLAGPQSIPAFLNLAAGTYTVRITDVCGTVGTASATVASGVAAPKAAGVASGTCSGANNGVITASSTGGALPLSYSLIDQVTTNVISGPQTSNVFTGLPAGTYTVRVTDTCGSASDSADIVLGNLTTAPTISTSTAIDCSGTAILGGFGGSGNGGPFTYAICSASGCTSFSAFASASTFLVNSSGTYRIAVRDRCGNETSSGDIVVDIPIKGVMTGVTKENACGSTAIIPAFTFVPNTAIFSIDGSNFSPSLGTYLPGCHTIRVADFNAGTYGCASDPFEFSVFEVSSLIIPGIADVNCASGAVTINTSGGSAGCAGAASTPGVKLTACTGCSGTADAIGSIRSGSQVTFNMSGATQASFAPVVSAGNTELCAGTVVNLDFAADYCAGPLPLSIEYIRGNKNGHAHILIWKVNCINTPNVKMSLERSADGRNFTSVYIISAEAVRCQQPFDYNDMTPLNGLNYYRIKLVDADGRVSYSAIVALLNKTSGFEIVGIVPNPVTKNVETIMTITSAQKAKLNIMVYDIAGRKFLTQVTSVLPGINQVKIDLSRLAAGSYQVSAFMNESLSRTITVIKH